MDTIGIDIDQIVELETQVASSGTLRAGEMSLDSTWEQIIVVVTTLSKPDLA